MGSRNRHLLLLLVLIGTLAASGCEGAAQAVPQLAVNQTLRLPIDAEPRAGGTSLDPAFLADSLETSIGDNLFDGLYRVNEQMQEVPDIALDFPTVSADGLIYTFHLRHDVRFWNGDAVTAADVVYSWNRAAALQGNWAFIFQPLVGYATVANGTPGARLALSTPDPYTLVAQLSQPSGYWVVSLSLSAAWLVDQRAIADGGPNRWWTSSQDLVGTGPFRLTNWTPGAELDFAPVENGWGGSTGTLKKVELDVTPRAEDWAGYRSGRFDMVGYGVPNLGVSDAAELASFRADPKTSNQVHSWPFGTTSWVGFNLQSGPFSGYGAGTQLRKAFSEAIDRKKLADAICHGGTICVTASGGLISKGLVAYLGDGADPNSRFDPVAAKAVVTKLDPNGALLHGLVLYFPIDAYDPTQAMAANLTAQWRSNLGVEVSSVGLDRGTFFTEQASGKFTIWREGWEADYDHPQDWFDSLFTSTASCGLPNCNFSGTTYDKPGYSALIASLDQEPLKDALPGYRQAGKLLVDDSVIAVLYYLQRTAVTKPYLQGYGANLLWENRWTAMRILEH